MYAPTEAPHRTTVFPRPLLSRAHIMRILPITTLLLAADAFTAPQRLVKSVATSPRRIVSLCDHMGISEKDTKSASEASIRASAESSAQVQPPTEVDYGKAIFLANADENSEVREVIAAEKEKKELVSERLDEVKAFTVDETVNAVLQASEDAVAAAEATLADAVAADAVADEASVIDTVEDKIEVVAPATENVNILLQTEEAEAVSMIEIVTPVKKDATVETIEAPSVSKILKFAVPAVGVWLCSPLLSLIDTSAVGILSGTVHQAALNPAVAVTDYAALLIAFMYTGSTNMIAAAREKDRGSLDHSRTTKTLIGSMQLSTFVGAGLGIFLFALAPTLLRAIIGNDGISPAVFSAALKYVRIRALGMPAAAMIGTAQAACLGMQDIRSPLYVLLAAAAVNFFGDIFFVGSVHPLIGGAAGAAWATVFSQYAAMAMFVHWLCNKPKKPPAVNLSSAILELTGKPTTKNEGSRKRFVDAVKSFRFTTSSQPQSAHTGEKASSSSVRGFLEGKLRKRDLTKLPSRETMKEFAPYFVPVTSTQVGRVSGYVAMSHVVSSSLGTISMAAQQVIVSLFYCLCPIADSLSLTAQSFLPSISEKPKSTERSKALRRTISNFLKAGGVFGAVMVSAVSCIPLLSGFFTTDPLVTTLVNMVVPILVGIFAVHGLVCSTEGLLLGQKDLGFLGKMYAVFFAVVPYFMLRVKRAALSSNIPGAVNLTSVWKVFLSYQLVRCVAWGARVAALQRRTEHGTAL